MGSRPYILFFYIVVNSRPFCCFCLLKQTILQSINVNNYPSSIRCLESNSQHLVKQSPPIITRPGGGSVPTICTQAGKSVDGGISAQFRKNEHGSGDKFSGICTYIHFCTVSPLKYFCALWQKLCFNFAKNDGIYLLFHIGKPNNNNDQILNDKKRLF